MAYIHPYIQSYTDGYKSEMWLVGDILGFEAAPFVDLQLDWIENK